MALRLACEKCHNIGVLASERHLSTWARSRAIVYGAGEEHGRRAGVCSNCISAAVYRAVCGIASAETNPTPLDEHAGHHRPVAGCWMCLGNGR